MIIKMLRKDTISKSDYMEDYNTVSNTYGRWIDKMGQYTDRIIKPDLINNEGKIKLLDLACGTGYITEKLFRGNPEFDITAVDISEEMLNGINDSFKRNITVVHEDVIDFLRDNTDLYDGIYCGWALPYFNYNELIDGMFKRLKSGGIVSVISNSKGTLSGMESIFLSVMKKHPDKIHKPMGIRYQLPNNKNEIVWWFQKYGFTPIEVDENEVEFFFNSPEELLEWLMQSGALAGTRKIFKDYQVVKADLIKEIEKKKYKNGHYVINHKFVYGIFKK
jgi:ubiquinone/menaquinone biosynthesis C-methylase UbiE